MSKKVMEARLDKGKVIFEYTNDKGEKDRYVHFDYLRGKSKWAKILQADQYGNYAIDIYPSGEYTLDDIKATAEGIIEEAKGLVEGLGKKVTATGAVTKEDNEDVEYMQFKRKEFNAKGEAVPPPKIYNKYGDLEEDWDKLVGNGSEVKIGCVMTPYYMATTKTVGVSLKLYAVQVIDLVEYEGSSGGNNAGFGNEAGTDPDAPFDTDGKDF